MTMKEPADLKRFFKEGMQARAEHRRLAENPYDVRTPEHREWKAGWTATFDLDEDDDPESTRVKTDRDADPTDDSGPGPFSD